MSKQVPPKEALDPLLVEFSNLRAYGDAIRQQLELISSVIAEYSLSRAALEEVRKREGKGEALIHIGAGNYIMAELKGVKTVVVGIGAGVSVEKSIDDAISEIDGRVKEAQERLVTLQNQFVQISTRMQQLQGRIDQLYGQLEATGQA
jgi:prefoldin alpha subunit